MSLPHALEELPLRDFPSRNASVVCERETVVVTLPRTRELEVGRGGGGERAPLGDHRPEQILQTGRKRLATSTWPSWTRTISFVQST